MRQPSPNCRGAVRGSAVVLFVLISGVALAQEAPPEGALDDDAQAAVDDANCTDAAMRASLEKVRARVEETTAGAGAEAERMMFAGLAACAKGNLAKADALFQEALEVADAGITDAFGTDEAKGVSKQPLPPESVAADAATDPQTAPVDTEAAEPWWKFW